MGKLKGSPEQTREFRERYNLHHIELSEGEQILEVTSDHFMEWLPKVIPLALFGLVCLSWAFFASSGVGVEMSAPPDTALNPLTITLGIVLVIILFFWFRSERRKPKNGSQISRFTPTLFYGFSAFVMMGLILLSLQGTPTMTFPTSFQIDAEDILNGFNLVMVLLAMLSAALAVYVVIEAENDHLILTDRRVLLSDRQVFGAYNIDQIYIQDIQNVVSDTETYFRHWLKYGTIKIKSTRKTITFPRAEMAQSFQTKVDGEVRALRGEQTHQDFKEIIDTEVYKDPGAKKQTQPSLQLSESPSLLQRFLPDNPQASEDGTITWRKHWIFLIRTLILPTVIAIGSFMLVIALALPQIGLISGFFATLLSLMVLLAYAAWSAYRIEDHLNDRYILTPTNVVDIEKKPWGPENRRSASIDAIQNVENKTSLLGRTVFKYGNVNLETAAAGQFTFFRVPYPDEVVRMINQYQDDYRLGARKRSMKDMARLLEYYHSEQIRRGELANGNGHNGHADPQPSPPPAPVPEAQPAAIVPVYQGSYGQPVPIPEQQVISPSAPRQTQYPAAQPQPWIADPNAPTQAQHPTGRPAPVRPDAPTQAQHPTGRPAPVSPDAPTQAQHPIEGSTPVSPSTSHPQQRPSRPAPVSPDAPTQHQPVNPNAPTQASEERIRDLEHLLQYYQSTQQSQPPANAYEEQQQRDLERLLRYNNPSS